MHTLFHSRSSYFLVFMLTGLVTLKETEEAWYTVLLIVNPELKFKRIKKDKRLRKCDRDKILCDIAYEQFASDSAEKLNTPRRAKSLSVPDRANKVHANFCIF